MAAAAASSSNELHAKMDAMHQLIMSMNFNSPGEDFEKYASYFATDGKCYMKGMYVPPSIGREQIAKDLQQLYAYWSLPERRVISRAVSEDGTTAISEMDNVITIAGERIEHFLETEVVQFENGLIREYRLYADVTPVQEVFQKKQAAAAAAATTT